MKINKNGFASIIIVLSVIAVLAGGYFIYKIYTPTNIKYNMPAVQSPILSNKIADDQKQDGVASNVVQSEINDNKCVVKDGQCCKDGACSTKTNACDNGHTPMLEGCDADCNPVVNCNSGGCWVEGGDFSVGSIRENDKCCSGLTPLPEKYINRDSGKCVDDHIFTICLKCGDGICGKDENDCNCPQDCKVRLGCAKEGEFFYDHLRQCCEGLQIKYIQGCTDGVVPCDIYTPKMTCVGPSATTCEQLCNNKGYSTGYCGGSNFIKSGLSQRNTGCKGDDLETTSVHDNDINNYGCGKSDSNGNWNVCCCGNPSSDLCAKEGEIFGGALEGDEGRLCCAGLEIIPTDKGYTCKKIGRICADDGEFVYRDASKGPTRCCDSDAGISKAPPTEGCGASAIGTCVKDWDKICGNGICELGEDSCNCPKDCKDPACKPVVCG